MFCVFLSPSPDSPQMAHFPCVAMSPFGSFFQRDICSSLSLRSPHVSMQTAYRSNLTLKCTRKVSFFLFDLGI